VKSGLRIPLVFLCFVLTQTAVGQDERRSLDQWIRLLESDDPAVRCGAIETLHDAGQDASNLVPRLQEMARSDSAPEVRAEAVRCLVDIAETHDGNAELFLETLRSDEDLAVRLAAANAIESTQRSDDEVVAAFNQLANDLSTDADFSNELEKWIWRIGWAILLGAVAVVAIGVIRYIVFRDLRRTLITASLALAFLPQVRVSAFNFQRELRPGFSPGSWCRSRLGFAWSGCCL